MCVEGSLGCGRAAQRSWGAAAVVAPADGCIDVILRGDDVHLTDPSTVCIPTSPDVGETVDVRLDPELAARVLRSSPAEAHDLAAPLRNIVRVVHAAGVARTLRALRSFGTASKVGLLTSPADGWVGLVRRAAAVGAGTAQVAGGIDWSARRLRHRMLMTFGYGYSTLVRIAWMRWVLSLMGPGRGSPTSPAAMRWLSRAATEEQPEPRPSLTAVAYTAGYADQAHMTRDLRPLVGRTPAQVVGDQA